ncbi:MAG: pantetheine-phosphate adenylyltransferase [Flavobacteriales bacterium]|nr:pantetheine-phosphate adenylyltransferase [Flavobacteriales bacterium]MCX7649505.1 pantetheine-phosphate adenylyltransferase [Flavobacteriales bacterium]MDW8431790.1 pantetheine-phosphate adenylyltransferase [Flavobacteriales bacterium]
MASAVQRIALYPGTFDPVTLGHEAIVKRALPLFDRIVVAIGYNAKKPDSYFSLEQRLDMLQRVFGALPQVEVRHYSGLTTDFCHQVGARFILRGLRSSADFSYERNIAQANNTLAPEIETVFIISSPGLSNINSSIVRDIHRNGGPISAFLPEALHALFK